MIKGPPHAYEESEPSQSTVDLLNSYLQVLKKKFALLVQALLYFSVGEVQHRHEQFFATFEQLKLEERALMVRLHSAKDSTAVDKRTFERFCLRIYEQFEFATQKLKKIKLSCLSATDLTTSLQGILFQSKPESSIVNVGDFLLKVISCEETFKLHSIRKVHNLVKKTDPILAEECKLLFKQELALKISYDQQYQIAEMTGGHYEPNSWHRGVRHSLPLAVADVQANEYQTMENALKTNRLVFRKKASIGSQSLPVTRPPLPDRRHREYPQTIVPRPTTRVCNHCQCLKLLEVANMEEFSHNQPADEKGLQKLLALNQRNIREVERFRRLAKRAARNQLRSQQRVDRPVRAEYNHEDELVSPLPPLQYPTTPIEYDILTDNRPTSISIARKRVNGTRSVMFNKESGSTTEDQKKGESLKKMTEKLKRPSLAKLVEKRQQLQNLRDFVSANAYKAFNSFNGGDPNDKSRQHEPEQIFRPREILALPRISRK